MALTGLLPDFCVIETAFIIGEKSLDKNKYQSIFCYLGGAGAVFWMWVAAFFGMMTNFAENVLGLYFRRKNSEGEWSGGAMYYLQDGLGNYKGCKQHC